MDAYSPMQGTSEWKAARCGFCTASRFSDVMAKIKSGEAADRRNYRAELVVERLTKIPVDGYVSREMIYGTEQEPFARMAYEARFKVLVVEQGFVEHPTLPWIGASPDGFVGDGGIVEIKCPNTATHIHAILAGFPREHVPQVQGNLWVSGRQWCDFVSFDSRMPEKLQLGVWRVKRDDVYIKTLEAECKKFLAEVDEVVEALQKKAA